MSSPRVYRSPLRYEDHNVDNMYQLLFDSSPVISVPDSQIVYIHAHTSTSRTRGQHIDRVKRLATALVGRQADGGLGLTRNERVCILSENHMDFNIIAHACFYSGIPCVLMNIHATKEELVHAIDSTPSRIFISGQTLTSHIESLRYTRTFARIRSTVRDGKSLRGIVDLNGGRDLDTLLADTRDMDTSPMCKVKRSDLACMLFSSGTSGMPKAVMISHGNFISAIFQASAHVRALLKSAGVPLPQQMMRLTTIPMYHTQGFFTSCLRNHCVVNTCVILPRWEVEAALKAIQKWVKLQLCYIFNTRYLGTKSKRLR
ncbi:uncharacterized protein EI90DRAFT_3051948 [Cantharellus anzutake]|uniref:uncharacterized protein n=1 Tax=Cantharellus anzutake TaxID=1750568 RepID=UPI001908F819|nr:uncharacterized protein EI90DRAFT_3051948 [Cantharellus anzutake]KAF8333417.1 hypothetical protein EI90DRAFT_3051948 [Cantharellus anzutake]